MERHRLGQETALRLKEVLALLVVKKVSGQLVLMELMIILRYQTTVILLLVVVIGRLKLLLM